MIGKLRLVSVILTVVLAIVLAVVLTRTAAGGNIGRPALNTIRDGKIYVDNYKAGTPAEYYLMIYNANSHNATFSVDFRIADTLIDGYTRAPADVSEWVVISDTRPLIRPQEWYTVTIELDMPAKAAPPADKWEFWIGVIDLSQSGNIRVELCQRWLITMEPQYVLAIIITAAVAIVLAVVLGRRRKPAV